MNARIISSAELDICSACRARNKVYNRKKVIAWAEKTAANIEKQHLEHEVKLARKAENIRKAEKAKAEALKQKRLQSVASGFHQSRSTGRVPIADHLGLPVAQSSADAESEHIFALGSTSTRWVLPPGHDIRPTPHHPLSSFCNFPSSSSSMSSRYNEKRRCY